MEGSLSLRNTIPSKLWRIFVGCFWLCLPGDKVFVYVYVWPPVAKGLEKPETFAWG